MVEGHGEIEAIPLLLRRHLSAVGRHSIQVERPFRIKRHAIVRPGEFERALSTAITLRGGSRAVSVIVILDADDDCPVTLAAGLRQRATTVVPGSVKVVAATRESEAWILADIEHISHTIGWPLRSSAPSDPEDVRGAKEWLRSNLAGPTPYKPTEHQAKLFAHMRLDAARARARSLDKLLRDITDLTVPD